MYFITDYEKLQGKTIGFVHMAMFANPIVIGTTDGGIMVAKIEYDENEFQEGMAIKVLGEMAAEHYLVKPRADNWLMREMVEGGVMKPGDLEEFTRKREEATRLRLEKIAAEIQERDQKEYLRLKEKFEGMGKQDATQG